MRCMLFKTSVARETKRAWAPRSPNTTSAGHPPRSWRTAKTTKLDRLTQHINFLTLRKELRIFSILDLI